MPSDDLHRSGDRSALLDRAAGALLGQACGDALGVPYEFGSRPLHGDPEMLGGGLGDYAPGEWSDDTQMRSASPGGRAGRRPHDRRRARAVARLRHADGLPVEVVGPVVGSGARRRGRGPVRPHVRTRLPCPRAARQWAACISRADSVGSMLFSPNGFTVTALQAAGAPITFTDNGDPGHFERGLQAAAHAGDATR